MGKDLEPTRLYQALVDLGRSLASCTDPDGAVAEVYRTLREIVTFDYLALLIYEGTPESMRAHTVPVDLRPPNTGFEKFDLADSPIGWSWHKQEIIVVRRAEEETRWPGFARQMVSSGIPSLVALPLTAGGEKVGVLGFAWRREYEPDESELAFLHRVAAEFGVTIKEYLSRKELALERDRLRVLQEISNALVSKLSPDDLFGAISAQLNRIIPHSSASIALYDREADELRLQSLQVEGVKRGEYIGKRSPLAHTPMAEAISTRRPVIIDNFDLAGLTPEVSQSFGPITGHYFLRVCNCQWSWG